METNSVPLSRAEEDFSPREQGIFKQALRGFLRIFQSVVLPHACWALVLLLITSFTTYHFLVIFFPFPAFLAKSLLVLFLIGYALAAFVYLLLTSGLSALRRACMVWSEFIEDLFARVQAHALAQIDNADDRLPKPQAKVLVTGSVAQVIKSLPAQGSSSLGKWISSFALNCVAWAIRFVLVAKIVKVAGKTIQIGKLFAGRATLAGAVFLNLRFFSTLLLCTLYILGGLLLVGNILLWVN